MRLQVRFPSAASLPGGFLTLLLLVMAQAAVSQVFYSTNPRYLHERLAVDAGSPDFLPAYPDTSVAHVHMYQPRNFMGNIGLPSPLYLPGFGGEEAGFRVYEPPYPNDRIGRRDVRYYRSLGPFASLSGIAGTKELQMFRLFFTHTYKKKMNIALRFNRNTNVGYYVRQQSYTNNLCLSGNYAGARDRYGFSFYFLNNQNRHSENGGIRGDTLGIRGLDLNKDIVPVNQLSASRDNREFELLLQPWMRFGPSDTTHLVHGFRLQTRLVSRRFLYRDTLPFLHGLYSDYFYDTLISRDLTRLRQVQNDLLYTVHLRQHGLFLNGGYRHELNAYTQKRDTIFANHLLVAQGGFRRAFGDTLRRQSLSLLADLQLVAAGLNAGDLRFESRNEWIYDIKRRRKIFANLYFERREPDQLFRHWRSNHFYWHNPLFVKQTRLQVQGGIRPLRWLEFSALAELTGRLLYYNENMLPQQHAGTIANTSLHTVLHHVFFRHLGLYLEHRFQQTSEPGIVRIPPQAVTARLFYAGNLSRNNLQLNTGLQLQVYDRFRPYAYAAPTQAFYLQQDFETSPYPFLDLYLNARIRPVTIFLRIENILQGLAGPDYSLVRGYYQTDRAFRFGITWVFFD